VYRHRLSASAPGLIIAAQPPLDMRRLDGMGMG
jgi:hypothetical protein